MANEILVQAWGGPGGNDWKFRHVEKIKQIAIVYGSILDSITFTSIRDDATVDATIKVGGDGGDTTVLVNIDGVKEYLTELTGTYGDFNDLNVINSISFHTNMTEYGPYGSNGGTPFSFVIQGGELVGFYGRSGIYVDAIGTYITPK